MNLHDDHLPTPWMERGNQYHWEDLTENELLWQGLDERPAQPPLLLGRAAHRVPAVTGTPGTDRLSCPSSMAPGGNRTFVAGPTFEAGRD